MGQMKYYVSLMKDTACVRKYKKFQVKKLFKSFDQIYIKFTNIYKSKLASLDLLLYIYIYIYS